MPGYRAPNKNVPPPDAAFLDRAWSAVEAAAGAANVAVVLGTERVVGGRPMITALVVDRDGSRLGFQDKVQIDPSEEITYTSGAERRTFQSGALTFGVVICHEGWRYPETVRWAARRGAQVVFHPQFHEADAGSYRPVSYADPRNTFHEKAALCRAAENTCYFATVNFAGEGSPTTSAVVRPDGTLLGFQPVRAGGAVHRRSRPVRGDRASRHSLQGLLTPRRLGAWSRCRRTATTLGEPSTDRVARRGRPAPCTPRARLYRA